MSSAFKKDFWDGGDTSIRADLRRAAAQPDPWDAVSVVGARVSYSFICIKDNQSAIFASEARRQMSWFLLLVAEAL